VLDGIDRETRELNQWTLPDELLDDL